MLESINFTSTQVLITFGTLITLVFLGLAFWKYKINQSIGQKGYSNQSKKAGLQYRNKYPQADVFQYRSNILLFSLALILGLMVSVMNVTVYDEVVEVEEFAFEIEEDIEIEPPRSTTPPPPPPPPPPPVIEEIPNELVLEADEIEFEDQSVDESTAIKDAPKYVEKKGNNLPPPPPPPPPAVEEVEEIFKIVEEMPRFPGCEDLAGSVQDKKACADKKLYEFLYEHLSYPSVARDNGIEGVVVIRFVVEKNGTIQGATVARDIGGGCGEEALRVINMMNAQSKVWIPGKQRGRSVRVLFTLPVRFKLAST